MLHRSFSVFLILTFLGGLTALIGQEPKPADKAAKADDKVAKADQNMLPMAKEWNSDKFASPPTKFR